ncbi:MAG TPA: hypothetical protein VG826_09915 [Pirellulales bacterium]|nr:hypothetical protein [Pirellulales bacterium]
MGTWLFLAALISAAVGTAFWVTTNGFASMFAMCAGVAIGVVLLGLGVWYRLPD